MSVEEALGYIEKLKNEIKHTNSTKWKIMCMVNILTIIDYLSDSHNFYVDDESIINSDLFQKSLNALDNECSQEIKEFLNINSLTNKLANGCINIYNQQKFNPFIFSKETYVDGKVLHEILDNFFGLFDNNIYKKYQEMSETSIGDPGDKGAGVCWDFFAIGKQSIDLEDSSPIDFTIGFVHEMGHAIHLDAISKIGKKKLNGSSLSEGPSLLFELLYINYLKDNNIDINHNLKTYFIDFLGYALKAKAGTMAKNKDLLIESDGSVYYTSDFLDPKNIGAYGYIFDDTPWLNDYVRPLYYFYGVLIALKFIDNYGMDYPVIAKELLNYMYRSELMSIEDSLEEISLNKVPNSLVKNLRRIR